MDVVFPGSLNYDAECSGGTFLMIIDGLMPDFRGVKSAANGQPIASVLMCGRWKIAATSCGDATRRMQRRSSSDGRRLLYFLHGSIAGPGIAAAVHSGKDNGFNDGKNCWEDLDGFDAEQL